MNPRLIIARTLILRRLPKLKVSPTNNTAHYGPVITGLPAGGTIEHAIGRSVAAERALAIAFEMTR